MLQLIHLIDNNAVTKRVHNNYYNLKQLRRQQQTPIHMDVHTYYYVCVSVCVHV